MTIFLFLPTLHLNLPVPSYPPFQSSCSFKLSISIFLFLPTLHSNLPVHLNSIPIFLFLPTHHSNLPVPFNSSFKSSCSFLHSIPIILFLQTFYYQKQASCYNLPSITVTKSSCLKNSPFQSFHNLVKSFIFQIPNISFYFILLMRLMGLYWI